MHSYWPIPYAAAPLWCINITTSGISQFPVSFNPQGSPCPGSSEIAPVAPKRFECSQPGYYADPQNCRWFFACMDLGGAELMAFEFRCPYGLMFDEKRLVCEWPWLVPACSESESTYTRTEYYGGHTAAGSSTGAATGGYITGGLPQYSVSAGRDHFNTDYSKASPGVHDVSYFTGPTAGYAGKQVSGADAVSGYVGSSGATGIDYSKSTGYGSIASSIPTGPPGIYGSISSAGKSSTGYSTSGSRISTGSTGYRTDDGYIASSGRVTTGFSGSTAGGYSGTAGGSHLTGGGAIYSGFSGSTGGYSGTAGGSHLTGGGAVYSDRPEPGYSAAGGYTGSVDASKPIVATYPKTGYFASTASPGPSVNIRVDSTGPKYVGSTGSSGSIGVDYSQPSGYEGSVSSIPTYTGPSSIHVDSISSAGKSSTGYSTSDSRISSTGSSGYRTDGGYSGGYTASSGGVTTDFSGSTAGGYSGSHLTGGYVTSGRPESNYSPTGYTEYTGSVDANKPIVVTYPKTGYFASTESPGSSINIRVDSTGPKYVGSNLYTSSGAFNADGYSASTGIYSGSSRQPSFDKTGIESSHPGAIGGSTAKIYEGSTGAGYSKATSGILQGSTSSGRVSSATHFGSDASKYVTSGISAISGHTDVTTADRVHFGGVSASGDASSTRYNDEEGYTVPVYLLHGEPIYPLVRPTAEIRNHTEIPDVIRPYAKPDLVRPNLNISIFGNEIPTAYDIPKGTIVTGSGVQGNIFTDSSGTVFSHGNIPSATSSPVIHEGTVLTGGVQPGYIVSGTPQPGYVITDELKTANIGSARPGTLYGPPTPAISVFGPSTPGVDLKGDITPGIGIISGQTVPGGVTTNIGNAVQSGIVETSTGKSYSSQAGTTYHGVGGAATRGCSSLPRPQGYKTDVGCGIVNAAYDTDKYSGSNVPDYRPTSATLPDSIVSGGRIEGTSNVIFGSTSQGSTIAPGYSSPTSAVFTPSGFTKTGLTKTGITTAILGGGGSFSVSTSERRPAYPENIGEKAFEGNVAGYSKIPSSSNAADLSVTSIPHDYSSIASSGRVTQQTATSGYSYPKPNVQLGTSGITFTPSSISIENNLPITSPKPFPSINVDDGSSGINVAFGAKIPTVPTDHRLSTPTIPSVVYTTKRPEIYKPTLFEAAKTPVSTVRPIIDYKTVTAPSNIPFLTDDRFNQKTGSSQAASISTSNIGLGTSFQQTEKDYGSSLVPDYLPAKSTQPGVIASTTRYEVPEVTVRPDDARFGVTYKKPSSFAYKGPSSISPTTFRPPNVYYTGQGFSSSTETTSSGSPTNLGISRDKIDKLITNYNRGTVKYMPSIYDTTASSGFGSTAKEFSSFEKSSFSAAGTVAFTAPSGPTSSYEVATKPSEGKGKVIVKWSDLHPLLLGKLGAECTCKADPFATLRGPVRKLISSSRGKVDLANYDESEIYVDLEHGSSEGETTDYDGFPEQPYKISPHETSTNQPSSSYLPVSSTTVGPRDFDPGFRVESSDNAPFAVNLGFRAGRKLKDVDSSSNSIADDLEEDPDQIINGATDCARPGLFRHPGLCNKFYACHWDQWKKKFTLHIFNCPIHLTFDSKASACNWPSKGPACQADNLLV